MRNISQEETFRLLDAYHASIPSVIPIPERDSRPEQDGTKIIREIYEDLALQSFYWGAARAPHPRNHDQIPPRGYHVPQGKTAVLNQEYGPVFYAIIEGWMPKPWKLSNTRRVQTAMGLRARSFQEAEEQAHFEAAMRFHNWGMDYLPPIPERIRTHTLAGPEKSYPVPGKHHVDTGLEIIQAPARETIPDHKGKALRSSRSWVLPPWQAFDQPRITKKNKYMSIRMEIALQRVHDEVSRRRPKPAPHVPPTNFEDDNPFDLA